MKLSQFCIQHSSCPWHHSQWHQPTKKHAGTYQVEDEVISCPMGRAHKRVAGLSWCRARPTGLQYILKQANKWRRLLIGHWRGDTAPSSCRVTNTDQVCNLFDNSSHMCIVLSNLWTSSVCHSHAVRGPLTFGFGQCWTTLCVWFRDDCIISIPGM